MLPPSLPSSSSPSLLRAASSSSASASSASASASNSNSSAGSRSTTARATPRRLSSPRTHRAPARQWPPMMAGVLLLLPSRYLWLYLNSLAHRLFPVPDVLCPIAGLGRVRCVRLSCLLCRCLRSFVRLFRWCPSSYARPRALGVSPPHLLNARA
ncbi:hypothetical protein FB451DRAFT_1282693 [Mycena latifolia]|nr:hypothetical protein FB451DRAFT_1282693 [Mycena latifolia]